MLIPVANWVELKTCAAAGSTKGIEKSVFNCFGRHRFHISKPTGKCRLSVTSPVTCLPKDHTGGLLISGTRAPCVTRKGKVPGAPCSPPRLTVLMPPYGPETTCGPKGQQGCTCLCTSSEGSFIWCLLGSALMMAPSLQGCTVFCGFFFFPVSGDSCSMGTLWHWCLMAFRLQSLLQQCQDHHLFAGLTDGFAEDPGTGVRKDLQRLLLEWKQCLMHVRLGFWTRQTWFLSWHFNRQNGC